MRRTGDLINNISGIRSRSVNNSIIAASECTTINAVMVYTTMYRLESTEHCMPLFAVDYTGLCIATFC